MRFGVFRCSAGGYLSTQQRWGTDLVDRFRSYVRFFPFFATCNSLHDGHEGPTAMLLPSRTPGVGVFEFFHMLQFTMNR